jgi:hypothetical protein
LCPHWSLFMNIYSSFVHTCQNMGTVFCASVFFSREANEETEVHQNSGVLLDLKKL